MTSLQFSNQAATIPNHYVGNTIFRIKTIVLKYTSPKFINFIIIQKLNIFIICINVLFKVLFFHFIFNHQTENIYMKTLLTKPKVQ